MDKGDTMIELFEQDLKSFDRQSSKGNQLKWENNKIWYKADYCGYEGLTEYVVSELLNYSNVKNIEHVAYSVEQIKYREVVYNGAKSEDFLTDDWQIITLERLYKDFCGESLYAKVWHIEGVKNRLEFLVSEIKRITGLSNLEQYISYLLTIDALFVNEDRHMHNIAILMNSNGEFDYCPVFDNGAGCLSDTRMDYPLGGDVMKYIDKVNAKTVCSSFDEQLDAVEELYRYDIKFSYNANDIEKVVNKATIYTEEVRERVKIVLKDRMRKYRYLFI